MVEQDRRGERGETLIEVIVSVVIMGVALVAVVGALATSIIMSDIHRKQARAGAYVRAFAEAIEKKVAASPSGYTSCATTDTYKSIYSTDDPTNYIAEVVTVTYWNGTAFVATCSPDSGVQRVEVRVRSADGRADETLAVVIRRPCRSATDFPADAPCS